MTIWKAELTGNLQHLQWLMINTDICTLENIKGKYYLSCSDFNVLNSLTDVRICASNIIMVLDSLVSFKLHSNANLTLQAILEFEKEILKKRYVSISGISSSSIDITAELSGGDIKTNFDSDIKYLLSGSDSSKRYLKALEFYKCKDWVGFYKIYELFRDDKIYSNQKGEFHDKIKRFTMTANNFKLSGDNGRHASGYIEGLMKEPKLKPMSIEEAHSFICELLIKWADVCKNEFE